MGDEKNDRFTLLNKVDISNLSEMTFKDLISPEIVQKLKEKYPIFIATTKYQDGQVYYYEMVFQVKTYYLYFTRTENEAYSSLKIYYPESKIEELKIFINSILKQK
jgi:uncharacterized protein YlxP (DUF503 family)